jgi:hypothetical protein
MERNRATDLETHVAIKIERDVIGGTDVEKRGGTFAPVLSDDFPN